MYNERDSLTSRYKIDGFHVVKISLSVNAHGKGMNTSLCSPAMGKTVKQTRFSKLSMTTGLKEP